MAIAIALVSILGAVVAFSGTLTEQDARRLDQQGIQDAARQQQIITDLQATVDEDLRYLTAYQEHIKAYDLGDRDKLLLNNLAANRLLLAIEDNQPSNYGSAISFLDAGLRLDDNDPLLHYNRGVALLGQGNGEAARAAYADAISHTVYTSVSAHTARNDAA